VIVGGRVDAEIAAKYLAEKRISPDDYKAALAAVERVNGAMQAGKLLPRNRLEGIRLALSETDDWKPFKIFVDRIQAAGAEIGKIYLGKVVRLVEFGAFLEILPGVEGRLPIIEVAEDRIRDIRDALKIGEQILVKVISVKGDKVGLSRKAVLRDQRASADLESG